MAYNALFLSLFAGVMVRSVYADDGWPSIVTKRAPMPSYGASSTFDRFAHISTPYLGAPMSYGASSELYNSVAAPSVSYVAGSSYPVSAYPSASGTGSYPAGESAVPSSYPVSNGGQTGNGQNGGQNGGQTGAQNGGPTGGLSGGLSGGGAAAQSNPNAASSLLESGTNVLVVLSAVAGVLALTL